MSALAQKTRLGEVAKWHQYLVVCGMIDADLSSKHKIVCSRPRSEGEREDLAAKTNWLRPHAGLDPVIDEVLAKMDEILKETA